MKKLFIFLILLGLFSFTACTKKPAVKEGKSQVKTALERGRPDFGQPEEKADMRGLVKSVVGNEVTLLTIDMSQFAGMKRGEAGESGEKTEKSALSAGSGKGGMYGMGRGMRSGEGGDSDMKSQMIEQMKNMSDGESTVIVPVGIQMLKPDPEAEAGQINMLEASLEDVKVDAMMQVWLDPAIEDRAVAKFVLLMN